MGLDVDFIAAQQATTELVLLLSDQGHGKREEIANEILAFLEMMKAKYPKELIECGCGSTQSPDGTHYCFDSKHKIL